MLSPVKEIKETDDRISVFIPCRQILPVLGLAGAAQGLSGERAVRREAESHSLWLRVEQGAL